MKTKLILILFVLASTISLAQSSQILHDIVVNWHEITTVTAPDGRKNSCLMADNCTPDPSRNFLPVLQIQIPVEDNMTVNSAEFSGIQESLLGWNELNSLTLFPVVEDNYHINASVFKSARKSFINIEIVPLKLDPSGLKKLISAQIRIQLSKQIQTKAGMDEYAANSVLSNGKWYRIRSAEQGVHKVTYADLAGMGVDMNKVTPQNIRLYGHGGSMLPEQTDHYRHDDLPEVAIKVVSANQNVFAPGDYFLFYSPGPHSRLLNTEKRFEHVQNIYSDYSFYFLNFDKTGGKRISSKQMPSGTPDYINESFLDFRYFEEDIYNPGKSGKNWLGHKFEASASVFTTPDFGFRNVLENEQCRFSYKVAGWALNGASFRISYLDQNVATAPLASLGNHYYATVSSGKKSFSLLGESQQFRLEFFPSSETDIGWLDYIEINQRCKLVYEGGQFYFSDPNTVWPGRLTKFSVQTTKADFSIWDVTDLQNPQSVEYSLVGGKAEFVVETDVLRGFQVWDNSQFKSISFDATVPNQNLHALRNIEMLIITPDNFITQSNRLADMHRTHDNLTVAVVPINKIYNEFSSGSQDITAIRDFCRMLYSDRNEKPLKYLLLFGDGSFDYKNRTPGNTNVIPPYLAEESYSGTDSYVSDDYYGKLDDGEGLNMAGGIDIGIGRFPVNTADEANLMVDKSIDYRFNTPKVLGSWRNSVTLVADDEDSNTHLNQVEDQLVPIIQSKYPVVNFRKLYLDAYKQVSTTKGHRFPDVNESIANQIKDGTLLLNFTGHGGILGWTDEYVLTVPEINSWKNYNKLPLFVTATCEFSRFDDPTEVSAGEMVLLNEKGGAFALLTTTRLAYAHTNVELTKDLYDTLFNRQSGLGPCLGDAFAYSKNCNPAIALRNFVLLGNPALRLSYPEYDVVTEKINGIEVNQFTDTISSLDVVTIEGYLADYSGARVNDFNGLIELSVFDKQQMQKTLANDADSYVREFAVQENLIYKGTSSVENGVFKASFIVPQDIDYSFGYGKISYYAQNGEKDASGMYKGMVIGGISENVLVDTTGPDITIYLENEGFKDGGQTSTNPVLIVHLSDESGINTTGTGIGHDILATLDSSMNTEYVLNNHYRSDRDSYRSGKVYFRLTDLEPGVHSITLKAWDIMNNSSESTVVFEAVNRHPVIISGLTAFPNPFSNEVNIQFSQDQQEKTFDVYIDIVNLTGAIVKTLGPYEIESSEAKCGPFSWDGNDFSGKNLTQGVYLLRVRLYSDDNYGDASVKVIKH